MGFLRAGEDTVEPADRLASGGWTPYPPGMRTRRIEDGKSIVAWLTSCPGKGYFVPIESESTDEVRPAEV
jgi:hypothetical protein